MTRFRQAIIRRKKQEAKEAEKKKKEIEKIKGVRNCLRCGEKMRPYKISDNPIKFVHLFRCKCYPKGYYTD